MRKLVQAGDDMTTIPPRGACKESRAPSPDVSPHRQGISRFLPAKPLNFPKACLAVWCKEQGLQQQNHPDAFSEVCETLPSIQEVGLETRSRG